jgi:transposase
MDIQPQKPLCIEGPKGALPVLADDEIAIKFAMLHEGQCLSNAMTAATKFGFSKQRYYQVLHAYEEKGAQALQSQPRGPKTNYRRTDETVRQIIRYRFLDPDASTQVIAQKLRQNGWPISARSVERVIAQYGLQKKTPHVSP